MKSITRPSPAAPTAEELTAYTPIVHQEVARLRRRLPPNVLRDDLVAAGTYGLLDALRRSVERGPSFERYARIRVRGALVDELRSQDWLTRRARMRRTGAESAGASVVGIDDLPGAQEGLADRGAPTPHDHVERRIDRLTLERAVAALPPREADIVTWHYVEGLPFKAIAARLGLSLARISQLHTRAMGLLRAMCRGADAP